MKILLTGATGYIGSQLAHRLVKEGHQLAILVRPKSNIEVLANLFDSVRVNVYDGSISSIVNALNEINTELVIHAASLFLAQHQVEDVSSLIESNLNFPTQLLEAMSMVGVKKLINTGTSWQHYDNENYNPVNLYAATKQAFESLILYYVKAHNLTTIDLKLFDTYGPGDTRKKLFTLLRNTARSGNLLKMSPGYQMLDLVYIDDVLDAYILAIKKIDSSSGFESYGVSNPERLSLQSLVKVYSEIVGRTLSIKWGGLSYRHREVFEPWCGSRALPNWKPKVNLYDGIILMEQDSRINGLLASRINENT